jgi:hypothetical protein
MQSTINIGDKYGKLTIVDFYTTKIKSGRSKIIAICKCECGGNHELSFQSLKYDCGESCPNCRRSPRNIKKRIRPTSIKRYYKNMISNCKRRNRNLNVTIEDIQKQLEKQNFKCALSGLDISIEDSTASLDRIDNSKDYTIDNIQWLHVNVNYMKVDLPQNVFIEFCHKISENMKI